MALGVLSWQLVAVLACGIAVNCCLGGFLVWPAGCAGGFLVWPSGCAGGFLVGPAGLRERR